jgi:hypothetical protein
MIQVPEHPEPSDFDTKVRTPGRAFLTRVPTPNSKQFKGENHWKNSLDDLHSLYNGVCAYSAHWIPRDVARPSVDHFIPKHIAPELAYEWRNFRLCAEKLNNYKDNSLVVMDPFMIKTGWFVIDFATFFIKAAAGLPEIIEDRITKTITCLKLNDDDHLVKERVNWVKAYCEGDVTFGFLERRCPFIAYELKRQDLKEKIKSMLKMPQTIVP